MELNDENFALYAAKHYDTSINHSTEEFYEDLKRFQYIKRLFRRYKDYGELKERLILNHIIILYNVFGPEATRLLFQKMPEFHSYLKPFILCLQMLPEKISYEGKTLIMSDITMDQDIIKILRKI